MSTTFRDATMSPTEREARAILAQPNTDSDMFSGATVRALLHDLDVMREVASEERDKWSFETLMRVGRALLAYTYPPEIFTGESGDSGPQFVVALRDAIERIDETEECTPPSIRRVTELLAYDIARRVSTTGARPEDWLSETFVARIVREHATDVLTKWLPRLDLTRAMASLESAVKKEKTG